MDAAAPFPDNQPTVRGLAAGQRHFGRFVLLRPLGRGGMGMVWLARDETLGEEVALKFLPDPVRWDPAALAELKAETRSARRLTHPHIVRIHDLVADGSGAAIAMEAIAGANLTQLRLERPGGVFDPADIAPWIGDLCAALDYAHGEARLVHRDLKPSNLMLTPQGRIMVTDFGVARGLTDSLTRVSGLASGGTLLYMSPQQAMGEPAAAADDIYSLGATLYELLAGKPPFHTGDVRGQLALRAPDSPSARRRAAGTAAVPLPAAWDETLLACLAKRPEDRPATAGAVARRLKVSAASPPSGARWRRRGLAGAALALALAGAGWWLSRPAAPLAEPAGDRRAVAAWNLDGDGTEAARRPFDLTVGQAVPTEDRAGRIDRALYFNGAGGAHVEALPLAGLPGDQPVTIALWVKPAEARAAGVLLSLRSTAQESLYYDVGLDAGRPTFVAGRLQADASEAATAPEPLAADRWSQITAVNDGRELRLLIDGREAARRRLEFLPAAVMTAAPALTLGYQHKFDTVRFVGALDDVRIWRRRLGPDELAELASPARPPRYRLTEGFYADSADLPGVIAREFGPGAELADWRDLVRWHAEDTAAWLDEIGIKVATGSPLVQREGRRWFEKGRHYFVNRFDGRKPDYYEAHAELGGYVLALGSWRMAGTQALVRLPAGTTDRVELAGGPAGVDHAFGAETGGVQALRLDWAQTLVRGRPDVGVEAGLRLKGGREVRARCAPAGAGSLAVALGSADRPEYSRQFPATFEQLDFALVVAPGRLTFRAVSRLGRQPVFQCAVALEGLEPGELAAVRLSAVDGAQLTLEH